MKQYAFSKKYRIQKPNEFSYVFSHGKKFYTKHLTGICVSNDLSYFRFGISIGKKFGDANKRNRFKRLLRESFRTSTFRFLQGKDLVVLPSLKEKILDYQVLKEELNHIMQEMIKK
ncbi:MAG: ribonuclease P protein component [Candidatus Brocadiae bacterium]|nr:ribonuclease P protein component [Candidatus Brocadiia bacterium]